MYGGYYFDNDILPLEDVTAALNPRATFNGHDLPRTRKRPGFLNAFVASVPHHPIVGRASFRCTRDGPARPTLIGRASTRSVQSPNIGTVLLRDRAARAELGDADVFEMERTGDVVGDVQLFREIVLDIGGAYDAGTLCVLCDTTNHCTACSRRPKDRASVQNARVHARQLRVPPALRCDEHVRPCVASTDTRARCHAEKKVVAPTRNT